MLTLLSETKEFQEGDLVWVPSCSELVSFRGEYVELKEPVVVFVADMDEASDVAITVLWKNRLWRLKRRNAYKITEGENNVGKINRGGRLEEPLLPEREPRE